MWLAVEKTETEQPGREIEGRYAAGNARQGVNGVVRTDIHRREAEQQVERNEAGRKRRGELAAGQQDNRTDADVRRRESRRGPFAVPLHETDTRVEQAAHAVGIFLNLRVQHEVVVRYGRKHPALQLPGAEQRIVELRPRYRQEQENRVEQEERTHDDKRRIFQLLVFAQPGVERDKHDNRKVRQIAQVESLTEYPRGEYPAEPFCRLEPENPLVGRGKHMVEVGHRAADVVRVGIPVAQQSHDVEDAQKLGHSRRIPPIGKIWNDHGAAKQPALQQQADRMADMRPQNHYGYRCQGGIEQRELFNAQQAATKRARTENL